MKIASVSVNGNFQVALMVNEQWHLVDNKIETWARSVQDVIERYPNGLPERIALSDSILEADLSFQAPSRAPKKIVCIGKNYADHAREMGGDPPSIPVVFSKFSSATRMI